MRLFRSHLEITKPVREHKIVQSDSKQVTLSFCFNSILKTGSVWDLHKGSLLWLQEVGHGSGMFDYCNQNDYDVVHVSTLWCSIICITVITGNINFESTSKRVNKSPYFHFEIIHSQDWLYQ